MTRTLRNTIENIEAGIHTITNKQFVVIIFLTISLTATAVSFWFKNKDIEKDKDSDIKVLIEKKFSSLHEYQKSKAVSDSINFIQINNKIDLQNTTNSGHFLLLEERIKYAMKLNASQVPKKKDDKITFAAQR